MIPGFRDWLNYRGEMLFGKEWHGKEVFNTTEVFMTMLGKSNYHYAIRELSPPLPPDFKKGRWLWSRGEAEKLWEWAYEQGWFNPLDKPTTLKNQPPPTSLR